MLTAIFSSPGGIPSSPPILLTLISFSTSWTLTWYRIRDAGFFPSLFSFILIGVQFVCWDVRLLLMKNRCLYNPEHYYRYCLKYVLQYWWGHYSKFLQPALHHLWLYFKGRNFCEGVSQGKKFAKFQWQTFTNDQWRCFLWKFYFRKCLL